MTDQHYPTIADWRRDLAAVRADGTGYDAADMFVEYAGDARFMESLTPAERREVHQEMQTFADVMTLDMSYVEEMDND